MLRLWVQEASRMRKNCSCVCIKYSYLYLYLCLQPENVVTGGGMRSTKSLEWQLAILGVTAHCSHWEVFSPHSCKYINTKYTIDKYTNSKIHKYKNTGMAAGHFWNQCSHWEVFSSHSLFFLFTQFHPFNLFLYFQPIVCDHRSLVTATYYMLQQFTCFWKTDQDEGIWLDCEQLSSEQPSCGSSSR